MRKKAFIPLIGLLCLLVSINSGCVKKEMKPIATPAPPTPTPIKTPSPTTCPYVDWGKEIVIKTEPETKPGWVVDEQSWANQNKEKENLDLNKKLYVSGTGIRDFDQAIAKENAMYAIASKTVQVLFSRINEANIIDDKLRQSKEYQTIQNNMKLTLADNIYGYIYNCNCLVRTYLMELCANESGKVDRAWRYAFLAELDYQELAKPVQKTRDQMLEKANAETDKTRSAAFNAHVIILNQISRHLLRH